MLFTNLFVVIFIIFCNCKCKTQKLEIRNLHQDPLLLLKINNCKIQTGVIKIIHPINLTNLEITIDTINNIVTNRVEDKLELYTIIKQKCKKVYDNFYQIKPPKHTRHRRWDTLGTAWKWLAGNPDAQDLRMINITMNELINENNHQFQINDQIDKRIQLLTDAINKVAVNTSIANRIVLTELELLTIIMNIDTINSILGDIQDAIIRTKVSLPSNKIISLKEIISIRNILVDQGVQISLPDEALKFITPKIALNEDTLLYILEVPKLEEYNSTIMTIAPVVVNGSIIQRYPQYLIKSKSRLFTTINHNNFVQKHTDIKEFKDDCIKPLIMGSQAKCNVTSETNTTVQFISEDKLLINNAKNAELSSNCGPDNRTLTGNFVITFWNCTVTVNLEEFQSYEWKSTDEEIQGALHNLQVTRHMITTPDIATINQENIQNRKRLNNVYLRQINHQAWIWTLSGGISFSTICIIILIVYICIHSNKTIVQIKNPNGTIPKDTSVQQNDHSTSYQDLLRKAGVGSKVEDALSPPPGGVIVS